MQSVHHIEAPVEKVFDFFFDPRKSADLFPATEVLDVKMTEDGVGTYASYRTKIAGVVPFEAFDVYTDVVPNKHITEKSSSALVGTWDYTFEPEGTGTRVTMEHHGRSVWRYPPMSNLMDLATSRMNESYMRRVKDRLESSGS